MDLKCVTTLSIYLELTGDGSVKYAGNRMWTVWCHHMALVNFADKGR